MRIYYIGPRCAFSCANISTRDGRTLSWGVFIVKSRNFKCSLSKTSTAFIVNGIIVKV